MKLSKQVCKRCRGRFFAWDEVDDHEWECGFVWCPWAGWADVNDWPHKNCRFAVEHIASYEPEEAEEGQEAMEGQAKEEGP